jgi:hypothetical protein
MQAPKTGGIPVALASLSMSERPTGLSQDNANIYYSMSTAGDDSIQNGAHPNLRGCAIMRVPKQGGAPVKITGDDSKDCLDIRVGGGFAYVLVADPPYLRHGVAQISLTGPTSLAASVVSLDRPELDVRRIRLDPDNVIAIDYQYLLRIPKAVFP